MGGCRTRTGRISLTVTDVCHCLNDGGALTLIEQTMPKGFRTTPKGGKSVGFSVGTFAHLKVQLRKDILTSVESSPEMRKEIARVFQMANRRIQNIEATGLYSPAVEALGKQNIDRYSKFSMKGSWTELKMEYGKAVSFLRQPTSTATGTREYGNYIKRTYELSDDEYKLMNQYLKQKLTSVSDTDFVERYLMRYKDFTGEVEMEAKDVATQIESEAMSIQSTLQGDIENIVDNLIGQMPDFEGGLMI